MAEHSSPTPRWLFGDQLGPHFDTRGRDVLLVESVHALGHKPFHRQKLHLTLSAIRHRAAELGDRATLLHAANYREALREFGRPVDVHAPTSRQADRFVRTLADESLVDRVDPAAGFSLSRNDFREWVGDRRTVRMEAFYRFQRERLGILMDGDRPVGGRWSLDEENREPPPKGAPTLDLPAPYRPREDDIDEGVREDLDRWTRDGIIDPIGNDGPRWFPVTRREALAALHRFVEHRLPHFGPHEDAMLAGDPVMAHSLLSVPMNLGLLDPLEVVAAVEDAYRAGRVELASAEGFVRQVIGWREYVWQLYWHFGPDYRHRNEHGATGPLPRWFARLDADAVQARCLSDVLAGVRDHGWVHHIPRLMVLGNWALQRGFRPSALSDWFRCAFVDGYEWVMPANVVGMSQHADGGAMATKPYLSGGAYIHRMSDYCGGCVYRPSERLGEKACPFTAGYWAALDRMSGDLAGNARMRRPLQNLRSLAGVEQVLAQERDRGAGPP
ncbi:cryptochrome/photolyase family protein [Nakamurella sp. YIM 132087]|uniref:Cryptochrome/photolyase family protein n=1 Tax=Nakamurella alba TaxID=2665158 RepID=A0A7K1FIC7_9ACTN|nr:cryptochrome/photolyase family protein [Nakamurella alba]